MTLRELIVERVLFVLTVEELFHRHHLTVDELAEISDLDLFELYEEVCIPSEIG